MRCSQCGAAVVGAGKFCAECGARLGVAPLPVEVRKSVTVVFCDLTGSTSLGERHDPETLRAVMTRYFSAMSAVLERHGGSVEKFIGDAVMAVFGMPVVHEDDALRAVRAAWEMQATLTSLSGEWADRYGVSVAARIGVNTGEVVVGDGSRGTVATGDAVNVAARLEQAAAPGEVLVGEATWRLVRGIAAAEPVPALSLKGKAEGVAAWRLTGAPAGVAEAPRPGAGFAAGLSAPLVGRDRELRLLDHALERAAADRTCQLFTVLGAAGVGKTRLVEEFRAGLTGGLAGGLTGGLTGDVRVLSGRCLSYGEGIVFFPLLQILRSAAGLVGGESDQEGRARLAALMEGLPEAASVVERLAPLAGLGGMAGAAEDTHWAVRRLVEAMAARSGALVLVVEDVHWAHPALSAVLEQLTDWLRDAPVLVVATARPEFLDTHPGWSGGKMNATTALLEPLDAGDTARLVGELLGGTGSDPSVVEPIAAAADGMPLFAEQLLGMLIDDRRLARAEDGSWKAVDDLSDLRLPATIGALLAARLDRLSIEERMVIEAASVVGQVSYVGAVIELVAGLPAEEVRRHLLTLVRKELLRPSESDITGEDAIRFRHVLIREAAYAGMSKTRRADLHERIAGWLDKPREAMAADPDQFVGHHLEQAVLLRRDLGPLDAAGVELAHQAADRLATAAQRLALADTPTATTLLHRATDLVGEQSSAWPSLQMRFATLLWIQMENTKAAEAGHRLVAVVEQHHDERWATIARATWIMFREDLLGQTASDDDFAFMDAALERFVAENDPLGVLYVANAKARLLSVRCRYGPKQEVDELRARAAEELSDDYAIAYISVESALGLHVGPIPVPEGLSRMSELLGASGPLTSLLEMLEFRMFRAVLLAYDDRGHEARREVEECRALVEDLSPTMHAIEGGFWAEVLEAVDDAAGAERLLEQAVQHLLGAGGYDAHVASFAPQLGQLCYRRGDLAAARDWLNLGRRLTGEHDLDAQVRWRALSAKLEARNGNADTARRLADEAVELVTRGDDIVLQAQCHADRAEVLDLAGRDQEAVEALRQALDCYQRKGHKPGARAIRQRLTDLEPSADGVQRARAEH